MEPLKVGDSAPDFDLPCALGTEKQQVKLSDFRGKKNVVLAFYALDWTPTWGLQMPAYEADRDKFAGYDAQVVGISMDSVFCHVAWQKHAIGVMSYPLASDFFPHGETARKYGVFRDTDPLPGISERAIFVIDKQGKIAFAKVYPLSQTPPNEEVFAVLERLK